MALSSSEDNKSLKSFLKIYSEVQISLKNDLDIYLFNILDKLFSIPQIEDKFGDFRKKDIEDYTKYMIRVIINAITFDDRVLLEESFEFLYRVFKNRNVDMAFMTELYEVMKRASYKTFLVKEVKDLEKIFDYLCENHSNFIKNSSSEKNSIKKENPFYLEQKTLYELLLDTKVDEADAFALAFVQEHGIEKFIDQLMRVVMMQIGYDWEINKISFSKEHLVSACFENILTKFLSTKVENTDPNSLILLVTPPSEHHSSGATSFAKILNSQGFYVKVLESQKSVDAILDQVQYYKPKIIAISVTLSTNLYEADDIIKQIYTKLDYVDVKVAIGGQAINHCAEASINIQADACLNSPQEAVEIFKKWLNKD